MKRFLFSLAATLLLFSGASNTIAQGLSVESLLDKAVSLTQKGDKSGTADALTQGVSALEKEAKSSDGSLKDKLLGKAGDLKNLIPLASSG